MKPSIRKAAAWPSALLLLAVGTSSRPSFAASPQAAGTGATSATAAPAPGGRAFARLSVPRRTLYVGESIPITVQAYYAAGTGVTVTGAPTANTPDFTLAVDDPTQGRAAIGDETYLVVTWKGRLSPAKADHYGLRITIPSQLEWREPAAQASPGPDANDVFGDPFGSLGQDDQGGDPFAAMQRRMQSMMNRALHDFDAGRVQKRDVTLESNGASLTVLPLPAEGRPPDFRGAVGRFDLDATVDHVQVRAGEPLELRLVVRGQGNLDGVSTPGLPDSKALKTYAPTVTQKGDSKTFVQAVVPQQPGAGEIPPVALSYFDPDAARYVTARSAAIPIEVMPGQALAATSTGVVPDAAGGPALAPNADVEGDTVRSLRPVYTHRGFWLAQLAPFGLLAAGAALVTRRRRIVADPLHALRRGARRALRAQRTAMGRAVAAGDGPRFFASARGALQQRLGLEWGVLPEAITLVEIERRVKGPQLDTLRGVFDADATRFGTGVGEHDLPRWHDAVRGVLAHPEVS